MVVELWVLGVMERGEEVGKSSKSNSNPSAL